MWQMYCKQFTKPACMLVTFDTLAKLKNFPTVNRVSGIFCLIPWRMWISQTDMSTSAPMSSMSLLPRCLNAGVLLLPWSPLMSNTQASVESLRTEHHCAHWSGTPRAKSIPNWSPFRTNGAVFPTNTQDLHNHLADTCCVFKA